MPTFISTAAPAGWNATRGARRHHSSGTRRALENLVRLAIEEAVDFLLIAGDIYDGDWEDHNTGLLAQQMARLRVREHVDAISGNHEAEQDDSSVLARQRSHLPSREPATERLDDLRVAIHGQSSLSPVVKEDLRALSRVLAGIFQRWTTSTSCHRKRRA
ncbi:MAG: metallophosphoesterase [Planctomycetota bacterium]